MKEEGNYHKTKTAFWGRRAAPSCTHLPKQKPGYVEVFLSFPLNASWYPALACGDLVLFKTASNLRLCSVLESFDSSQLSGVLLCGKYCGKVGLQWRPRTKGRPCPTSASMISTHKSSPENTGRIGAKWPGSLKGADVGNKVQRLSGCKE